jgi:ABC-type dipeptide/oligopeptide/nickel transport system permease component
VTNSFAIWLVLLLSLATANLPFLSTRVLGVLSPKVPKTLGLRLLELVVFYFLAGAVGLLLEKRAGQIAPQAWEFYAITFTLFVTFSFPGFVYRYLFKHKA